MWVVYTKSGCPQCVQAKNLLKSQGITFEEKNVEEDMEAMSIVSQSGSRNMPQISKEGVMVNGGLLGLQRMWREGKLK